jgi:hypothetical protein
MESPDAIYCPFCGQENQLFLEAGSGSQQFITDCEVCCRPFQVLVECEAGEIVSVEARG